MSRISQLEEQLNEGVIDEVGLFILWEYYKEEGANLWRDYIYEKNLKRKDLLRERVFKFEKRDTDFLKLYLDFLIYEAENTAKN